jgi:hypothetical protein
VASNRLQIVNASRHRTVRVERAIDAMRKALNIQLRDVARTWGEYVYTVVDDAHRQGFEIVLLDDADAADALGYHDLDATGRPYARVFVDPILDNGGAWLRGATSVSATVSHEVCELVGDPTANHWVETRAAAWSRWNCATPSRVVRTPSVYVTAGASVSPTSSIPTGSTPTCRMERASITWASCTSRSRSRPTAM